MTLEHELRFLVVVNRAAGRPGDVARVLRRGLAHHGLVARVVETPTIGEMRTAVAAAVDDGIHGFLAVGGDGTLHQLVNALPREGTIPRLALGSLPTGSGSDFARTFGQNDDVDAALARLVRCERYPIDVGWVEGAFGRRRFVNAANAGIAARSVSMADRLGRRLGPARYTAAFWLSLPGFPSAEVRVDVGRHRFTGAALNVVVANGQFFGGGLNVAPRATLIDGSFDVLVFTGARTNAFSVMPRLAMGSHLTHRAVRRYVGSDVRIRVPAEWPIEADGELLGHGSVDIGIEPGALDWLV